MASFLPDFRRLHDEAGAIVTSRDKEGRNAEVSVVDQFTVGDQSAAEFTMDIIEMKLKRARSYAAAGNFFKFKEEMQDISNYGIFCIVFEENAKPKIPEGGLAQPIRDAYEDLPRQPRPPAAPSSGHR